MANKAKQESPEQEIPQFDPSSLRASLRTRGLATGSTAARQAKAADEQSSAEDSTRLMVLKDLTYFVNRVEKARSAGEVVTALQTRTLGEAWYDKARGTAIARRVDMHKEEVRLNELSDDRVIDLIPGNAGVIKEVLQFDFTTMTEAQQRKAEKARDNAFHFVQAGPKLTLFEPNTPAPSRDLKHYKATGRSAVNTYQGLLDYTLYFLDTDSPTLDDVEESNVDFLLGQLSPALKGKEGKLVPVTERVGTLRKRHAQLTTKADTTLLEVQTNSGNEHFSGPRTLIPKAFATLNEKQYANLDIVQGTSEKRPTNEVYAAIVVELQVINKRQKECQKMKTWCEKQGLGEVHLTKANRENHNTTN